MRQLWGKPKVIDVIFLFYYTGCLFISIWLRKAVVEEALANK